MRIVIATDAWHPQINGVVRTLSTTAEALRARGHDVQAIVPGQFRTIPCPTYPEIRLAIAPGRAVAKTLRELDIYASADVFVFPSRTDTFGLVNIEALASGVPVAAFPVRGPLDIIGTHGCGHGGHARIGALDENLDSAIALALSADRSACAAEGQRYSWSNCTDQFLAGLEVRIDPEDALAA